MKKKKTIAQQENPETTVNGDEMEKTIIVNDLASQNKLKEELNNENDIEKTKAFVSEDIKTVNENDEYEYEYYTPHYLRNALIVSLCAFVVAAVVSFIYFKGTMDEEAKSFYISQGYMLSKDATATEDDIYSGKTAYVKGKKITGKFEEINLDLADATADDVLKGYTFYTNSGLKKGTIKGYSGSTNFSILTTSQIINCRNRYLPEPIFIRVDNNLKPENIKAGVQILDVIGTYTGE